MIETPKTEVTIKKFFEAFERLSPDEKLYFLTEIDKTLKGKDEKDRKLYLALIKAAREGKSCEDTILELKRV